MADLQVRTSDGLETELSVAALQRLEERLRGDLLRPDDPRYDAARRVYNGMHDRRPALVVHAVGVADVMAAVTFAAEHELLLSVRGGGHSVPGYGTCDGGLVLDLGRMRGIRVEPQNRTARVEGGCTWGDLDHATHAFGLATTGGIVSTTGVGGLTLGGGFGHLARRCGLSCDNLLAADVVTADGRFLTCSEEQEPDLFWAIRGGSGNFGVVTSFEFRLHPVSEIHGGPTFFRPDPEVLRRYSDFISGAPEQLGLIFAYAQAPPAPFLPEEWHAQPVCAAIACWSGPPEKGEECLAPLRSWGEVVGSAVGRMPYPPINQLFDALLPPGLQHHWKGSFVRDLPDEAIAVHHRHGPAVPTLESALLLFPIDGACHRVPPEGSAFAYRDARFAAVVSGTWSHPADGERTIGWVRDYHRDIRPFSEEGGYVNFMSHDDDGRIRANYLQNYDRLASIKSRYDPGNLFRLNHNIVPASQAVGRRM